VFTGFGVARDFEYGFARRLLLGAPRRSGIVLGYALAATGRWALTATILTIVALAVGMNVGGSGIDLVALYTLALFVNLAGAFWASGVAMRLRSVQAGPVMQLPVFLALFFAPVYVPLSLLEGWLHAVASVNPTTLLLEGGRSLISGSPEHVSVGFLVAISFYGVYRYSEDSVVYSTAVQADNVRAQQEQQGADRGVIEELHPRIADAELRNAPDCITPC
jgi:ABC-type multidrug transport system permease subunit